MMGLLLVGIGGALGSLLRFITGKILNKIDTNFPIATFMVNIIGSFGFGIFTSIDANESINLLIGYGFFGAFTTFSTFMYESAFMLGKNKKVNALIYIGSSLTFGIIGYAIGTAFKF